MGLKGLFPGSSQLIPILEKERRNHYAGGDKIPIPLRIHCHVMLYNFYERYEISYLGHFCHLRVDSGQLITIIAPCDDMNLYEIPYMGIIFPPRLDQVDSITELNLKRKLVESIC